MSDALEVRSLAAVSPQALCEASNEAFRDYPVSVQMTVGQLATMLRQNNVELNLSAGLFEAERLVGFWLNGVRTFDGHVVGYDSGTAICKAYRGRGWSGKLALLSDRLLIQRGVGRYFLEVLTQNETAYRMYLRRGFRVTRTLLCLRVDAPGGTDEALPTGLRLESGPLDPAPEHRLPAMEYRPSWQHTMQSMVNVRDEVRAVTVRSGDRVVGYGTIMPERGRITRLAFADSNWDGATPSAILRGLCGVAGAQAITANNVDPHARRTLGLLQRHGFQQYAEQYEMARELRG